MRTFNVSLYHGVGNIEQTKAQVLASTPHAASQVFVSQWFAGELAFPLRFESPNTWSAGTTASGQRIYIREV